MPAVESTASRTLPDSDHAAWQFSTPTEVHSRGELPRGRVDLLHPDRGIELTLSESTPKLNLLGVMLDAQLSPDTLCDAYERVNDLVATYQPSASRCHQVQVYWRRQRALSANVQVCFDLEVLTQTDLLQSDPRRSTLTEVPIGPIWQLTESDANEVALSDDTVLTGLPCVVVRPIGVDWSYVEAVPPLDFHRLEILRCEQRYQIRQLLFVDFLEKGVMLRSRVRGAVVTRNGDLATARALYQQLCTELPPLAT